MLLSHNVTQTYSLGPIRSSLETLRFELRPHIYIELWAFLFGVYVYVSLQDVNKNGQIEHT